jgi:hypothetical protein
MLHDILPLVLLLVTPEKLRDVMQSLLNEQE